MQKTNSFKLLVDVKDVPSLGYTVLHVVPGKKVLSERFEGGGFDA